MTRRVATLIALLVPLSLLSACLGPDSTTITVQFRDATGLFRGNDVGVRGVKVGEVVEIEPAGGHVDVTLRVDGDVPIPADAGALIVSRSVATDRYVELTPAYSSGPVMRSGTTLGLDRTRTPVEFEDLLASIEEISVAFSGPDGDAGPLNALLASTAENLEGRGATIGQGLADLATLLTTVEGSIGDIEGNLANLDQLTQALADNDALVRRFIGEVASATTMLDDQHAEIEATVEALAAMVEQVAAFVRDNRELISSQIDDFVSLSESLLDHEADLIRLLQTAPLLTQNLTRAIDDNGRLSFLTRVLDLVPGEVALRQLCESAPADLCDQLPVAELPLLDLLRELQGVRQP